MTMKIHQQFHFLHQQKYQKKKFLKKKTKFFFQSGIMITNSLFLQKFLNGDIDLRSIEQRDLRVR